MYLDDGASSSPSAGLPLEEGAGQAEVAGVEAPTSGFAFVHQLAQKICRGAGECQCLQDSGAVWVPLRALLLHSRAAELGERAHSEPHSTWHAWRLRRPRVKGIP